MGHKTSVWLPKPESFQDKMAMLDAALTGASYHDIAGQLQHKPKTAKEWLEQGSALREWYLSDGGYSRVCVNPETGRLFLTSNSTERAKAAWGRCKELIEDVERECMGVLKACGYYCSEDVGHVDCA